MGRLLCHHLEKELSQPDCTIVVEWLRIPAGAWAVASAIAALIDRLISNSASAPETSV